MAQYIQVDHDPFAQASDSPQLVPVDHDPFKEKQDGDVNFTHAGILGASDVLRGGVGFPLSIVDLGARVPTWASNVISGRSGSEASGWTPSGTPGEYPPSLNQTAQDWLTKQGLPTPENAPERYQSAAVKNWMFGPAGMAVGAAGNAIQQNNPSGNQNVSVGGQDIGLSPNDLMTAGLGAASQVSPVRTFALNAAKGTDAARIGEVGAKAGVPVYPSDVTPPGSVSGWLSRFYNSSPLSGGATRTADQQGALTQAQVGTMGSDAGEITPPVMNANYNRLGQGYEDFASRNTVNQQAGSQFLNDVGSTVSDDGLSADNARRLNAFVNQKIMPRVNNDYSLDGPNWHKIYKEAGDKARSTKDEELADSYRAIQDHARTAMTTSVNPKDAAEFANLNQQYRAMLALEPTANASIGSGVADQNAVMQGAKKYFPDITYDDQNALPQLAQVGQMLNKSGQGQNAFNMALHRTPFEAGQLASTFGSPLLALLNRSSNSAITPAEWRSPNLAQFYRTPAGLAAASQTLNLQRR